MRFWLEMSQAARLENDEENIPGAGDSIGSGIGRDAISETGESVFMETGKENAFRTGEEDEEGGADDRNKEG